MALVRGNWHTDKNSVGGTSRSVNHDHNSGSGGLLIVVVLMPSGENVNTMTYGGQSFGSAIMTKVIANSRMKIFSMSPTNSGVNTLTTTFTSQVNNPVAWHIQSFTGSSGTGVVSSNNTLVGNVHSRNVNNITPGSFMMAIGIHGSSAQGGNSQNSTIGGIVYSNSSKQGINSSVLSVGSVAPTGGLVPSGANNTVVVKMKTGANWKTVTNQRVEILAATPATKRKIIII